MFESIGEIMLPVDNNIREAILEAKGNIVISASAGTGKTHTTIQRIIRDAEKNSNYQTFAAITFTRKAAKDISKRLGPNKGEGFVGTNDNFIWLEIIQPFMYDFYGPEYKIKINPDFSDDNQVTTYEQGVTKIKNTQLMCKYRDVKKNFAFQLALKILVGSDAARRYIKAKYYRLYIDEYQDSDEDMHNLFMYLVDNLEVPLFVVGDSKQSIYGWRGAYSIGFTGLFEKPSFEKFDLFHNFRSNKAIQNYSNIFMPSVRKYYVEHDFSGEVELKAYSNESEILNYISEWIDSENKCAFLNFSNSEAELWSAKLNKLGIPFVYLASSPLDYANLESTHIWIARAIAHFILKKLYSEYDFMDEIPMPGLYKITDLKKILYKIKDSLGDYNSFKEQSVNLYNHLGYIDDIQKIESEIEKLFEVVNDDKYIPTYNQEEYKLTSGTIHSSKGLEYKQVIINAKDYDLSRQDIRYLHYVAITRPEEKLLIIASEYSIERYKGYIEKAIIRTRELGITIDMNNVIRIIE